MPPSYPLMRDISALVRKWPDRLTLSLIHISQYEKEQSELTAEISVLEKAVKSYEKHEKDADPWNNIILTQRERLTMSSRPANPKNARNKNVLVIGGSLQSLPDQ